MVNLARYKDSQIDVEKLIAELTDKQYSILSCLLFETSSKSIGRILKISNRTVEGHVNAIYKKTGFSRKNDLIQFIKFHGTEKTNKELEEHFKKLIYKDSKDRIITTSNEGKGRILFVCCLIVLILAFSVKRKDLCIKKISDSVYILRRESVIDKLQKKSNILDIKIIYGHGGAGKTTIAREYIKRAHHEISYEINAESFDSLNEGMLELAYTLAKTKKQQENLSFLNGIKNPHAKLRQISTFVYSNLMNIKDWCLLFDNVDDFSLLKRNCINTIPDTERMNNGQILITTRDYKNENFLQSTDRIEIGELTAKEKEYLFSKIIGGKINDTTRKCLNEIPNYPLDVSCCAYYIRNAHISLDEYLQRMKNANNSFWDNNKTIIAENTDYASTRNEIIASLFEQITKINPEFKHILFIISLMDSQNMPINLLRDIYDTTVIDDLIFCLSKFGIATFSNNSIFFHRSTFAHMFKYFQQTLDEKEKSNAIKKLISEITPYEKLCKKDLDLEKLIPHFRNLEKNFEIMKCRSDLKIPLLISIAFLLKEQYISALESVPYFQKGLDLNKKACILSKLEEFKIRLAAGKACLDSNQNQQALKYLKKSFVSSPYKGKFAVNYAKNYVYIGIGYIRGNHLPEALNCFGNAIGILEKEPQTFDVRLAKALAYLKQGRCYLMYYINKPQMNISLEKMRQAITILDKDTDKNDAIKIIARAKLIMAEVYNALKEYKKALLLADEAESWLGKLPKDNSYFCSMSMVLAEKGHATLRLNELKKAKSIFAEAHELMDKTMIGDYLFRTRMQEAETLIRLKDYKSAYQNCLDVFERKDKEKNDLCDLFFNTALYNAAVIKYKTGHYTEALKYFAKFALHMKDFCRSFLSEVQYEKLNKARAFEQVVDENDMKICFKNAWLIFSTVCLKGSEFITDYVEQNYKDAR